VHPRGALRQEVASDGSLAVQLTEWPIGITAHCRYEVQPGDSRGLREAQESDLRNIAAVCRAQGRELLLEIVTRAAGTARADTMARVLAHIYALDVRPDWWLLERQPNTQSWEDCARVINAYDGYCRGILLGLAAASEPRAALEVAAALPLVRGFVAGGSIAGGAAAAWLAGQLSDQPALAQVAERFAALAGAWSDAGDRRYDRPQRSAD